MTSRRTTDKVEDLVELKQHDATANNIGSRNIDGSFNSEGNSLAELSDASSPEPKVRKIGKE